MAARTTYLERYAAGEHEQVWAELQALGGIPQAGAAPRAPEAISALSVLTRDLLPI